MPTKLYRKTNKSARVGVKASISAKKALKTARQSILADICSRIAAAKSKNREVTPHKLISSIVLEMKDICDGKITRDVINYSYKKWFKIVAA